MFDYVCNKSEIMLNQRSNHFSIENKLHAVLLEKLYYHYRVFVMCN